MTEDQNIDEQWDDADFEEITSEEVDLVIAALEELSGRVSSETIKGMLDEVSNEVYYLIYEDDDTELSDAA